MWKYNYTDELYVSKNDEIYHSDTYLGKDFSDGIKHWKYLKKEMKNGHWVYYYNKALGDYERDIHENNIKREKHIIKNNITYTNPETGQKFGPDHYKKAIKYDYAELAVTNARIKAAKALAKTLNFIENIKFKNKGKTLLSKLFKKKK